MGIRTIVFDLDGTLIDSNRMKYDAYFTLFPSNDHHAQVIHAVLSEIFEQSRFVILKEILLRLDNRERGPLKQKVDKLAERYNEIVLEGAKTCPEKPGAEKALKRLAPVYGLYVSSTTPDAALKEIFRFRKWDGYFSAVFGYPHEKSETLRHIITSQKLMRDQVLVIGDGESDKKSAQENGTRFLQVTDQFRFEDLEHAIDAL